MNDEKIGLVVSKEIIEKTYYEFSAIDGLENKWLLEVFVDMLLKNIERAEEELYE